MEKAYLVDILKDTIEKKFGRKLRTPADYNALSLSIVKDVKENISLSTLKRIWKYVKSTHTPSENTLSILSRFIGFSDWDSFCEAVNKKTEYLSESIFLVGDAISINMLMPGDEIEFSWVPDRYCRVVYLGSGSFRILEARNSKIRVGDTFCTGLFSEGNPLYMTNLQHEGNTAPKNYVAGMRNGIKNLKLKKRSIVG